MNFVVIDLTHKKSADEVAAYAAAQQRQLREHFAACYDGDGISDAVRVGSPMAVVGSQATTLGLVAAAILSDESPILIWPSVPPGGPDGALGVHDWLADGRPVCNVYDDLCTQYGDAWTSCGSHEVCETRADPRLHACVELDDGTIWDREVCDRVEADTYTIDVAFDGKTFSVVMSNFNTPACFEPTPAAAAAAARKSPMNAPPTPPPHERYDWLDLSTAPNEVRPGGYAQRFDPQQGWTQVGAMRGYRAKLAALGLSRGHKRRSRRKSATATVTV